MRNLQEYARQCMRELDSIGIQYGDIESFVVNTRATSRWGQCRHLPNGKHSININATLLDENNSEKGLKQTIIHELLHSCKGGMGHKGEWARLASIVNRKLGYNITRTNSAESLGIKEHIVKKNYKYAFKCQNCGVVIKRQKASDFVNNYHRYWCGKCGQEKGRFQRIL